ncbi:MAG TPA: hypothetical protein PKV93_13120, partial [Fervidobacterium sp.]|nr:hypothetical protein [Fervidobacterium sp.]
MKLRRGESRVVYLQVDDEPVEREVVLNMVQGKPLSETRSVVKQFQKVTETTWVDKRGQPQAKSYCDSVISISIKPANAEEKQKELLDELKAGLEAISKDDCSLDDIRRALKA